MHATGAKVPAIEERPSVTGLEWLWSAFWTLDSCRQIGMAPGRIPWTAIQQFADVNRYGAEETWVLHEVIPAMDRRLHQYYDAEAKKQTTPNGTRSRK